MPELDLRQVQQFVQTFIVDPGTDAQAMDRAARGTGLAAEGLVLPSPTLDPAQRLQIYRNQYLLRMGEALGIDYPGLKDFLGEGDFDRLVKAYVQVYPSRSHTLNRLGDHLPDFLAARTRAWRSGAFLRDLARLELALTQVGEEAESPVLTTEGLADLPMEAWERARLRPVEALRLLELNWPAHEYLRSVSQEAPRPEIRPRRNFVVAWRHENRNWRMGLSRPAGRTLRRLLEGAPLAEALSAERGANPQDVFDWFSSWVAEGFFSRLEL